MNKNLGTNEGKQLSTLLALATSLYVMLLQALVATTCTLLQATHTNLMLLSRLSLASRPSLV